MEKFREIVKEEPRELKYWIILILMHFLDRFFYLLVSSAIVQVLLYSMRIT
jgi:hypothetical protein